jgi:PAS domain S-box-containing protein
MNDSSTGDALDPWAALDSWSERLKYIWAVLRRSAPLVQIILAILALVVGIWFGNLWRETQENLSKLLISTLGTKTEIVAQPYAGLETYLLSSFGPAKEHLKMPPGVKALVANIKRGLMTPADKATLPEPNISIKGSQDDGNTSSHSQYLSLQEAKDSFLFVPAFLVPRSGSSRPALSKTDVDDFMKLDSETKLAHDVRLTAALGMSLMHFDSETIEDQTIFQSYIMTETGVLAIRKSGLSGSGQVAYFDGLLPPHRFFPERAYFWPTVEHVTAEDEFDSVSEAYVDSAGNGPTRTYCKRLTEQNMPACVLCLDTSLTDKKAIASLTELIGLLDGRPYEVLCTVSGGGQDCEFARAIPPEYKGSGHLKWLTDATIRARAEEKFAEVFGRVATPECEDATCDREKIEFTVPIETSLEGDLRRVRLLWAQVDLGSVRKKASTNAAVAVGGFSTFVSLVAFVLIDYRSTKKQQREVLESVSRVMKDASTAFAWTDESNHFVHANEAFCKMLGYTSFDDLSTDLEGRKRTFRELLTPQFRKDYDKILTESKMGEPTDPYDAEILTKQGRALPVKAYAERVPVPSFSLRSLPHRFGVLIEKTSPTEFGQPESAT